MIAGFGNDDLTGTQSRAMSKLTPDEAALLDAASNNQVAEAARLLAKGVRPTASAGGPAALHYAVRNQSLELVRLLLRHGADPNQLKPSLGRGRVETPLYVATLGVMAERKDSAEIVAALASAGAHLNTPDADDNLPLHVCVQKGSLTLIAHLIECGADVNASNSLGNTPLQIACHATTWQPPEILDLLLSKGAVCTPDTCRDLLARARTKSERNHRDAFVRRLERLAATPIAAPSPTPSPTPSRPGTCSIACPACGRRLTASVEHLGKQGRCNHCLAEFPITAPHAAPSAASGILVVSDGVETRDWQVLQSLPRDRWLAEFPDYDVAYLRTAYPTGNSGDHAAASAPLLLQGVFAARRKSWLLGRLAALAAWQGHGVEAFGFAVSCLLAAARVDVDSPGDLVGAANLVVVVLRQAGQAAVAERLERLLSRYDESKEMGAKYQAAAGLLARPEHRPLMLQAIGLLTQKFPAADSRPAPEAPRAVPPPAAGQPAATPRGTPTAPARAPSPPRPAPAVPTSPLDASPRAAPPAQREPANDILALKLVRAATNCGLLEARAVLARCQAGEAVVVALAGNPGSAAALDELRGMGLPIAADASGPAVTPPTTYPGATNPTAPPSRTGDTIPAQATTAGEPGQAAFVTPRTASVTLQLLGVPGFNLVAACRALLAASSLTLLEVRKVFEQCQAGKSVTVVLRYDEGLSKTLRTLRGLGLDATVRLDSGDEA